MAFFFSAKDEEISLFLEICLGDIVWWVEVILCDFGGKLLIWIPFSVLGGRGLCLYLGKKKQKQKNKNKEINALIITTSVLILSFFFIYDSILCDVWVYSYIHKNERGGNYPKEGGGRVGWEILVGGEGRQTRGGVILSGEEVEEGGEEGVGEEGEEGEEEEGKEVAGEKEGLGEDGDGDEVFEEDEGDSEGKSVGKQEKERDWLVLARFFGGGFL